MDEEKYERLIDKQIREAQESGAFSDLPGFGKPLADEGQYDELWWVKSVVAREKLDMSAALPLPLALRKEIQNLPGVLAAKPTESMVREPVEELNERIGLARRGVHEGPLPPPARVDVEAAAKPAEKAAEKAADKAAAKPTEKPAGQAEA